VWKREVWLSGGGLNFRWLFGVTGSDEERRRTAGVLDFWAVIFELVCYSVMVV